MAAAVHSKGVSAAKMSSDEFGALMGYINATTDEADETNSEEVRVRSHAHSPSSRFLSVDQVLSAPDSPAAARAAWLLGPTSAGRRCL